MLRLFACDSFLLVMQEICFHCRKNFPIDGKSSTANGAIWKRYTEKDESLLFELCGKLRDHPR